MRTMRVVECKLPGLSCCDHRLVAPGMPADNVMRVEVWCSRWRWGAGTSVICRCDDDYEVKKQ
jgi:hypothetical protein